MEFKKIYNLKDVCGVWHSLSLKTIYRKIFDKEFCIDNIQDLPGEEWKPLEFNNKYLVSNKGRIKSLCRYESMLLTPTTHNGYLRVKINKKNMFVHRLVGLYFLPKPKPEENTIHHKNAKRKENDIINLMWLSRSENSRLAHIQE